MARAAKMQGDPTEDGAAILDAAKKYRELEGELSAKRTATKATTGGKTIWRDACVKKNVDPVILADAVSLVMQLERDPEKITRNWHLMIGYLKALGFFDNLVPGLFDDFEVHMAEEAAA